jgi:hypothetical protein
MLVDPSGYRDIDAPTPQIAPDYPLCVALVGADAPGAQPRSPTIRPLLDLPALHKGPRAYHLVSLALAEKEDHRLSKPFRSQVYCKKSHPESCLAPRSLDRPFAPGAC